jgi:hypothetical protein
MIRHQPTGQLAQAAGASPPRRGQNMAVPMASAPLNARVTRSLSQTSTWRRILLWTLGLGLGLAVVAGTSWWYVASGRLARRIEAEYASFLPGQLTLGRLSLGGFQHLVLRDVVISDPANPGPPLVRVPRIDVQLDLFGDGLESITAIGIDGHLDAANYRLLDGIIEAISHTPPSDPPTAWRLTCLDGGCEIVGTPVVARAVTVDGPITGGIYDLDCHGLLVDEPVRARVHTDPLVAGAKRMSVDITTVALVNTLDFVAAAESIGILLPVPAGLKEWIPPRIDATGSSVRCDLVDRHTGGESPPVWSALIATRWPAGRLSANMTADPRRMVFSNIELTDPALGSCSDGTLAVDLGADALSITLPGPWRPGTQAPIPAEVPVDALLGVLPAVNAEVAVGQGRESVALTFSGKDSAKGKARLAFAWQPGAPLRIEGRELPMSLVQPWLGTAVEASGGLASELRIALDLDKPMLESLRDCWLRFRQARVRIGGWSFGPTDGECAVRPGGPLGTAPFAATLSLTRPLGQTQANLASFAWNGTLASGNLTWEIRELEGFSARLKGPAQAPGLRGTVNGALKLVITPETTTATLERLDLSGVAVAWPAAGGPRDLVHSVDSRMRGVLTVTPGELRVQAGGHLRRGTLILPGIPVDLAERRPIFTVQARISTVGEQPGSVTVDELLVRAANAAGAPDPEGFSLQVAGTLNPLGDGRFTILVDQADLAWLQRSLPQLAGVVTGRAALVGTATLVTGSISRIVGELLPLSVDLNLGGRLRASGITGAIRFTLTPPPQPDKP